jgi:hypothetical protein
MIGIQRKGKLKKFLSIFHSCTCAADVLVQAQEGSEAVVMPQTVAGVLWLAESKSMTAVQCHFRTEYRYESPAHISIWFWDNKLRTKGSLLCEKAPAKPGTTEKM